MPELPEVETWRRLAEREGVGHTIRTAKAAIDRIVMDETPPSTLESLLPGRIIRSAERRGKHLWLVFDTPGHLYIHFGMSGSLTAHDPGQGPSHTKLTLELDNGRILTVRNPRRIGKIRWYENALEAKPIAGLGPDPLLDSLSAADIAAAFAGRKRPIKTALLDQHLFAGVGNWIADEVLYQAAIDPHTPCGELDPRTIRHLLNTLQIVLQNAVEVEADDTRFPKTWLFHHRWGKRAEQTARGETIRFDTLGGRTCAWVPQRQRPS